MEYLSDTYFNIYAAKCLKKTLRIDLSEILNGILLVVAPCSPLLMFFLHKFF